MSQDKPISLLAIKMWNFLYCLDAKATQPANTCSKLTIETLEQGVKYVRS